MLKKAALRRIMVSSIALIIVSILCLFPKKDLKQIEMNTNYIAVNKTPVFLLNKDNYVIRTTIPIENSDYMLKIKELIASLTIGNEKNDYIPKNFKPIIPENTKLLDYSLKNGLLKLNFSKEFLNVPKDNEEKLIEALVYTLTEIKEVQELMIFIENTKLDVLPQSKLALPNTIKRDFGINKIYDLTNLKDSSKTTIYYVGKEDNIFYYVPVTKITNNNDNKIKIIIDELKTSPIYETNLISYLASSVELLNYEELENQITLSFNNTILSNLEEKDILEEVKYSISLSIKDAYPVDNVIFKVDNEVIATFEEN